MIRVVLDTNVLVSALLKPESLPAAVLLLALSGRVQLCVSEPVLAEYEAVIRRPRLKCAADVIEGAMRAMRTQGRRVEPTMGVCACGDPEDNKFLACAEASDADHLVTGNKRHFPDRWKNTLVVGPRQLIELLIGEQPPRQKGTTEG